MCRLVTSAMKKAAYLSAMEKKVERGEEKEQTGTDQRRDETTLGRRRKGCEQRERKREREFPEKVIPRGL